MFENKSSTKHKSVPQYTLKEAMITKYLYSFRPKRVRFDYMRNKFFSSQDIIKLPLISSLCILVSFQLLINSRYTNCQLSSPHALMVPRARRFNSAFNQNQVPSTSTTRKAALLFNPRSHVINLNTHQNMQPVTQDPSMSIQSTQSINSNNNDQYIIEARGPLTRNLYNQALNRGVRQFNSNSPPSSGLSSQSVASSSSSGLSSWHFPRITPEHAAEVIMTGAQVINRIAQVESPLNYCKTPDNQDGECSDIRKCIWLVLDKSRLKQSVCLRNLIIPAVCCPISNSTNTPIANMIQSTFEPMLFRPKQPKQKKIFENSQAQLKPLSVLIDKTIVSNPPPSPVSMIIRNQNNKTENQSASSPSQQLIIKPQLPVTIQDSPTTTTTSSTTSTTSTPASASSTTALSTINSSLTEHTHPTLFQSDSHKPFNRTISQKYPWANETCGESSRTRTGRIVGGSDTKLGQWPWMSAMYLNKHSQFSGTAGEFWCGGALINKRYILTAAHCLSDQRGNRYTSDQVTIKLGGVDLAKHQAPQDMLRNGDLETERSSLFSFGQHHKTKQRNDEEEEFSWTSFITKALGLTSATSSSNSNTANNAQTNKAAEKKQQLAAHAKKTYFKEYRVASVKQHPKFQRHGFYNDIGLIELKSAVDYDDLISPVCLPSEYDLKRDMSGYMATVLGWGTLSYGGQGSKLLQQVSMPIWNNKDCDDRYLQPIGKTFLCAGFLTGGKDACQGDSGGPLMISDGTGRWTLHGVVSFGKTCAQANYPGVYTRVSEYLDWIRENTAN